MVPPILLHIHGSWLIGVRLVNSWAGGDEAIVHFLVLRGVGGRLKRTKKNPARAGWLRRLALARATSRAEVDVISVQRC